MKQTKAPDRIPEQEIQMEFVRSQGPGGQNVNKVSTAVHLRFDVENSPSLSEHVKKRLIRIAGSRVDTKGILHIQAFSYRTQHLNREDALNRLNDLVKQACIVPKKRIKTSPTLASKERTLEAKRMTSRIKSMRKPVKDHDD